MSKDTEAAKPPWLRMSYPEFLDERPEKEWTDLTPWIPWALDLGRRIDSRDSGKHRSGFQRSNATAIGNLGERAHCVWYGLKFRQRLNLSGEGNPGADADDGSDVKTTTKWYNPWLIVPRSQKAAPRYSLVAMRIEGDLATPGARVLAAPVWRIEREVMLRLAKEAEAIDPKTFVFWYDNDVPHYCVCWAQAPLAPLPARVAKVEEAPPPPPPPAKDAGVIKEAVRQMRLTLGK